MTLRTAAFTDCTWRRDPLRAHKTASQGLLWVTLYGSRQQNAGHQATTGADAWDVDR